MLTLSDISWTGIIAAALASFLLGGLWFTLLFGRAYARALGRAPVPKSRPAPLMIVGSALWGLITAFATAVLMARLGSGTLPEALGLGLSLAAAIWPRPRSIPASTPTSRAPFFMAPSAGPIIWPQLW
ncbi:DUF1761 domain-containing protein [Salipiger marinus]|uniref:DUF1761 domain-containing protein n=1 Tax=Salipiger marinus TaxID=555512 RepID=UPI002C25253C|nr:DUF1761 domain-containing protein [Salipiger manganoxidans]MEB3421075.1 DUF1761 domain-containing protein [Salipiger manganoxidans]